ncbi:MAG: hypothetical protein CL678_17315 [Bdellovibrionaceae bacterium]|nr:hypothetical protein [Pseudobdellovibrionaceae bacterium]|tara:strand:+ start:136 stop:1506 length:1371 start_codon:yes stop_codon:yes gene_type:complete
MKFFQLTFFYLLSSCIFIQISFSEEALLRFEGFPEVSFYQLQISQDRRYKKIIKNIKIQNPNRVLNFPENWIRKKAYFRVRGVFQDRSVTGWFPIYKINWKNPKIEKRIIISKSDNGEKEIEWDEIKSAKGNPVEYEITLKEYHSKKTISKSKIIGNSYVFPKLPGGDYTFEIQILGAPQLGTVKIGSTKPTMSLLEVEAIDWDPQSEKKQNEKKTLLHLMDNFNSGLNLYNELETIISKGQNKIQLDEIIQLNWESGFQFQFNLPFILLDSNGSNKAPRLGGNSYPQFSFGYRVIGNPHHYAGIKLGYQTTIDTTGKSAQVSNRVYSSLLGRISFNKISFDLTATGGTGFRTSSSINGTHTEIDTKFYLESSLFAHYEVYDFLRIGGFVSWTQTPAQVFYSQNTSSQIDGKNLIFIAPRAHYQIKEWLQVYAYFGPTFGDEQSILSGRFGCALNF